MQAREQVMREQQKQVGTLIGRPMVVSHNMPSIKDAGIRFGDAEAMKRASREVAQAAIERYRRQRRASQ